MKKQAAYTGARIFDGERFFDQHALIVDNDLIAGIVPEAALQNNAERYEKIALGGGLLSAGFIDAQVNGGGGVMLNDAPTPQSMYQIAEGHRLYGTTSLLPTLITDEKNVRDAAIEAAIEAVTSDKGVLGLHLEGPHLAPARKGAHLAELMRPVNDDDIALYISTVKKIGTLLLTLAAEQVTPEQVRQLANAGVTVCIGHSDCSAEAAFARFAAGASGVTHLYNAMSQITHRNPGLAAAALDRSEIYCGIVADGHHVDPIALRIALRAKRGEGKLFFVTDAMSLVGSDKDSFQINGREVKRVAGGICPKLVLDDGTIAGSDLDMASAIRFAVAELDLSLAESLRMASLYPARFLGVKDRGSLETGKRADFVHMDDKLFVNNVWRSGKKLETPVKPTQFSHYDLAFR